MIIWDLRFKSIEPVIFKLTSGSRLPADPNEFYKLLPGAFLIATLSAVEIFSATSALSAKTGDKNDFNRDLYGQSIAGILSSFFGCYPSSGSFSRTALNYNSGAKSKVSSIITGLTVALCAIVFQKICNICHTLHFARLSLPLS